MTNSQKKTIEIYQKLVHANAMTQTYMLARKLGIFEQLVEGQKTAEQIAQDRHIAEAGSLLDRVLAVVAVAVALVQCSSI